MEVLQDTCPDGPQSCGVAPQFTRSWSDITGLMAQGPFGLGNGGRASRARATVAAAGAGCAFATGAAAGLARGSCGSTICRPGFGVSAIAVAATGSGAGVVAAGVATGAGVGAGATAGTATAGKAPGEDGAGAASAAGFASAAPGALAAGAASGFAAGVCACGVSPTDFGAGVAAGDAAAMAAGWPTNATLSRSRSYCRTRVVVPASRANTGLPGAASTCDFSTSSRIAGRTCTALPLVRLMSA